MTVNSNYLKLYDSKRDWNYVFFKKTISTGPFTFGDFQCTIPSVVRVFTQTLWVSDKIAFIQPCNLLDQATKNIMSKAFINGYGSNPATGYSISTTRETATDYNVLTSVTFAQGNIATYCASAYMNAELKGVMRLVVNDIPVPSYGTPQPCWIDKGFTKYPENPLWCFWTTPSANNIDFYI